MKIVFRSRNFNIFLQYNIQIYKFYILPFSFIINIEEGDNYMIKKELIFLGPPACGKGTQTNRLSEYLGFPHVDTGSLLRAEMSAER